MLINWVVLLEYNSSNLSLIAIKYVDCKYLKVLFHGLKSEEFVSITDDNFQIYGSFCCIEQTNHFSVEFIKSSMHSPYMDVQYIYSKQKQKYFIQNQPAVLD